MNLTSEEMTVAVRKAFDALDDQQKVEINNQVKILIRNMKKKYPKCVFGRDSALELIACLGMAVNDNRLRLIK